MQMQSPLENYFVKLVSTVTQDGDWDISEMNGLAYEVPTVYRPANPPGR